jgi:hypothetical protein
MPITDRVNCISAQSVVGTDHNFEVVNSVSR